MGNSSSSGNGDRNLNEDGSSNGGGSSNEGSSGFGGGIAATRRSTMLGSRALSARITGGGSNNNGVDSNSHNNRRNSVGLPHLNLPSSLPSPFRSGGSLGLTRSELDDRCKPSGLYPTCEWEPKQIRRLISNGLLAARLRGNDSRLTKTDRECPICFMYYSESNVSKCCNATLCTECYLQIKPGKDRYCICPFCNNPKMQVSVARGMDAGDVAKREEEEQRVIEATIKSRVSELHGESPGPSSHSGEGANADGAGGTGFGSSLEIYNRRRTFSNASNVSAASGGSGAGPAAPINPTGSSDADNSALLSLAMTPEDRRALESEMRAQLSHQTHRNMEREADEARMRHAQEWYGTQGAARSRMREARLAELNGLLERMTARGGGVAGGRDNNNNNEDGEGDNSLMAGANEGFRGAAGPRYGGTGSLNRLLRSMEQNSSTRGAGGNSLEDLMRLEAAFFLGMDGDARAHRRGLLGRNPNVDTDLHENNNNDEDDDEEEDDGLGLAGMMPRPSPFGSSRASRRAVRRLGGGSNRGVSSTHLDTAELLMRGVSEEEQLAMAIAMSMQDNPQNQQSESNSEQQQGQAAQAEDGSGDDSSSSGESASSSSDSSEDDDDDVAGGGGGQVEATNNTNNNSQGSGNNSDRRASGGSGNSNVSGAGSLNEDEEQVVFTDMAEV